MGRLYIDQLGQIVTIHKGEDASCKECIYDQYRVKGKCYGETMEPVGVDCLEGDDDTPAGAGNRWILAGVN